MKSNTNIFNFICLALMTLLILISVVLLFRIDRYVRNDALNYTRGDAGELPMLNYVDVNINGQPLRINTENMTQSFELDTLNADTDIIISATETEYYDIYFDLNYSRNNGTNC